MDNFYSGHDDLEREKKKEENLNLLLKIFLLLNNCDHREGPEKAEIILLLGCIGAGKSALINTLVKAVCGQYFPIADTGKGSTASKTVTLNRYPHLGIKRRMIVDATYRDVISRGFDKLPTIYDAAGLGNVNTPAMKEILLLIMQGYIQPGTTMEWMLKKQRDVGVGNLKGVFKNPKAEWKISKVLFVIGCNETVPSHLVECLNSVLRTTDNKTGCLVCTTDVSVILSKYDLVDSESGFHSGEGAVSPKRYEQLREDVARCFSLENAMRDNCTNFVSYVDEHGVDNPHIDNIALKLIEKIVFKSIAKPPQADPTEVRTPNSGWWLWLRQFLYINLFMIALVVLVLAIIYGWLSTMSLDSRHRHYRN